MDRDSLTNMTRTETEYAARILRVLVHIEEHLDEPSFTPVPARSNAMDVDIQTLDPTHVAFIRHVGPYHEVGETWQRLFGWAGMSGLLGPMTRTFGLCYDDPAVTAADKLRYDACIVAKEGFQPQGDVGVQEVAGGEYATVVHEGPYEEFQQTYAWLLGEWFPASGRTPAAGPCIEFYLNDPRSTAPADLRTRICVPMDA
jgi:AraC family transcriptional regulator